MLINVEMDMVVGMIFVVLSSMIGQREDND